MQDLPANPSYRESCDLVDNSPDDFWYQILDYIADKHKLAQVPVTGAGDNWLQISRQLFPI